MNAKHKMLAATLLTSLSFVIPAAHADDDNPNLFVKKYEQGSVKKVSKQQTTDTVSSKSDKADAKRDGQVERNQTVNFLKMITQESGG